MMFANIVGNFLYHYLGINGTGAWYGFWSGFGSDLGEVTILAAILGIYRHHKCVTCWRFAHHKTDDTGQKFCHHHYTHDCVDVQREKHKAKYPNHIAHTEVKFDQPS